MRSPSASSFCPACPNSLCFDEFILRAYPYTLLNTEAHSAFHTEDLN